MPKIFNVGQLGTEEIISIWFAGETDVGSSESVYFVLNVLKGYSLPTVFLHVYESIEVKRTAYTRCAPNNTGKCF